MAKARRAKKGASRHVVPRGVVGSRSKQAIKRSGGRRGPEIRSRTYCNLYGNMSPRRRHSDPLAAQSAFPVSYRGSPSLSCGDEPRLSLSLSLSFRASASSWNITAMTNAFLYPVTSILDANGPFHAGPCRYLMYLPWIHAKHGGSCIDRVACPLHLLISLSLVRLLLSLLLLVENA